MASTSENQEKAPKCAAFVKAMREVFGEDEIEVLYVREGELELGKLDVEPAHQD